MSQPVCSLREWDTAFFGYPVARLNERHIDAGVLAEAFDWCATHAVRCLYYLAPAEDAPSLLAAQAAGMQFVDVRLTLAHMLGPGQSWPVAAIVTPSVESDRTSLLALAPCFSRVSRFFADPRFGSEAAVRLYETWLQKKADAVFVTRATHGVSGCIMCVVEPDGTGVISLLAVGPGHSRQGLGKALCAAGLNWFVERGCTRARVVTQGHSVASQRIYQRAGFVTQSVEIWFHKWFDERQMQKDGA